MAHELVTEASRLRLDLETLLWKGSVESEVPLRIHSRDIDGGGLGAPAFSPAFLRYVDHRVCECGRPAQCAPGCRWEKDHVLGHLRECQPACKDDGRFHASRHEHSPTRLKRALRAVRKLNPHAYDLLYMLVALRMSFDDATAKLNSDNLARGKPVRSDAEFAVLYVSGASMLQAAW